MAAALALFLCAVALAPTSLLGYERGAPARTDTCRNLQPGHGRPGDHGYSLELIGRPTSYDDTTVIQGTECHDDVTTNMNIEIISP